MDKRERLEKTLNGESADRVPAALWRPWPGDDQRAADLARAVVDYQRQYDWDFCVVMPAPGYLTVDYGLQDEWQGAPDGQRMTVRHPVKRSLDWTELRALEPARGELARHLMCLRMIDEALRTERVPVLMTIHSPLAQAEKLAGRELMIRNMRRHPDRLRTGLNVLTESTLRFIEALRPTGIAGIYYILSHADYDLLSHDEYTAFGLTQDRKIFDALPNIWWFNMLHLPGCSPMFDLVEQLPAQATNWNAASGKPGLVESRALFKGVACGGLDTERHLLTGTPAIIRTTARSVITEMTGSRLIVSAGGPVPVTTPLSNLRAVRESVEGTGA